MLPRWFRFTICVSTFIRSIGSTMLAEFLRFPNISQVENAADTHAGRCVILSSNVQKWYVEHLTYLFA